MIMVGIENCTSCDDMHKKHPEIPFIKVPIEDSKADKDTFMIKNAIHRLGIDKFPVILNDSLTLVIPFDYIKD